MSNSVELVVSAKNDMEVGRALFDASCLLENNESCLLVINFEGAQIIKEIIKDESGDVLIRSPENY